MQITERPTAYGDHAYLQRMKPPMQDKWTPRLCTPATCWIKKIRINESIWNRLATLLNGEVPDYGDFLEQRRQLMAQKDQNMV